MQIYTPTTSEVHGIQYLSLRHLLRVWNGAIDLGNGKIHLTSAITVNVCRESLAGEKSQNVEETPWIEVAIITTVQHAVTHLSV